MTSKIAPLAILMALTLGAPVAAQDANVDINGDGMYSFPELMAVQPEITEEQFESLDTSGDGLLDAEEIAAGVAAGVLQS